LLIGPAAVVVAGAFTTWLAIRTPDEGCFVLATVLTRRLPRRQLSN
jgi:hypothetical protein